jgi:hypothetical protein
MKMRYKIAMIIYKKKYFYIFIVLNKIICEIEIYIIKMKYFEESVKGENN